MLAGGEDPLITATRTDHKPDLLASWPFSSRKRSPLVPNEMTPIWDTDLSRLIVIIAPAECISILGTVLQPLQMDLPAAIVILVHGHTERDRPLAVNLNKGRFPVETGRVGTRLRNGHALIVQADEFLGVGKFDRLKMSLPVPGEKNESLLLRSLVSRYGRNTIGVVLTSLDAAETEAMQTIRSRGGRTIALDDSDRGWLNENAAKVVPDSHDLCLAAEAIGTEIASLVTTLSV